jgi:proteasome alpha subunit
MPFYVSPEQAMRDKADYARKGIARGRSCVALQYAGGILMVAPNPSSALHKISEIYDRIAFAAVGRYNEYENLRKAGVTYADITGYQFDRHDVTARGIANWYAQTLGTIFTESNKPFEVEIVVAEVGAQPGDDQIYRITFDGSVTDEPGFVAFGGQADQVSAALKERYSEGMSLGEAFDAALDALAAPANGERNEVATSLEVAVLERAREHRTFRRIRAARLEELIAETRAAKSAAAGSPDADSSDAATSDADSSDAGSPDATTSDAGSSEAGSSDATPAEAGSPASAPDPAPIVGSAPPAAPEPPTGPPIGPDVGSTDRGSGTGGPPAGPPL